MEVSLDLDNKGWETRLCSVITFEDNSHSCKINSSENQLSSQNLCTSPGKKMEDSEDVNVQCRIDKRALLSIELRVICLSCSELGNVFHICKPINFGVCWLISKVRVGVICLHLQGRNRMIRPQRMTSPKKRDKRKNQRRDFASLETKMVTCGIDWRRSRNIFADCSMVYNEREGLG